MPVARYTALSLDHRRIAQAYPVIQAATGLSLAQWRRFAHNVMTGSGAPRADRGVRCVAGPDSYIHGLYSYLLTEHLTCGRVLLCNHIVALDIVRVSDAERALYDDMNDVARGLECQAVHVQVPAAPGGATPVPGEDHRLFEWGFTPESVELCRKVPSGQRDG